MTTMQRRPPRRQAPPSIQGRADLLALQWTHGVEVRLRPIDPDGCTDLADDVRAVVGVWLALPGRRGPMPLVSARVWVRERLRGTEGARTVLQTQDADELLCAVLTSEDSGLVVTPLRRRLSA